MKIQLILGSVSKIDAKMLLRLFDPKTILNFKGVVLPLREIWEHLQAKKTFEEILLTQPRS